MTITLVSFLEGRRLTPYYDSAAVLTVCDGHTGNVDKSRTMTNEECDEILRRDLSSSFADVDRSIKVPLPPMTRVAIASFAFNIGGANLATSSLARRLNAGEGPMACQAMMRFVCITVREGQGDIAGSCQSAKRNKRFVKGLQNRREIERDLCIEGFTGVSP